MNRSCARAVTLAVLLVLGATGLARGAAVPEVARLGVLIPLGPPDYTAFDRRFVLERTDRFGPFRYRVGTVAGVPVVANIAPLDGPLVRSLATQVMLLHYHVKAVIYAGTSGAHLPPPQMRAGDIVLGADNVDHGNFAMDKAGDLIGEEFHDSPSSLGRYRDLFIDPALLPLLACSAHRVAASTALPGWMNPGMRAVHPGIWYFGIQGTSTMWLSNPAFIRKIYRAFGTVDEDGDWYSALAATLYGVPFVEVSVISDSIFEFPSSAQGVPPEPRPMAAAIAAQNLSTAIALDLISRYGRTILTGSFRTRTDAPFPRAWFATPADSRALLTGRTCT